MRFRIQSLSISLFATASLMPLFGCSQNYDGRSRLINAVSGSPSLDARVDGTTIASSIGFGHNSLYTVVSAQLGRTVQIVTSGNASSTLLSVKGDVLDRTDYSYFLTGSMSSPQLAILTDDHTQPAAGMLKLRIINGDASGSPADVYITSTDGTSVSGVPAVAALPTAGASSYFALPAGSYQILLTKAGSPKQVLAASGLLVLAVGTINTAVVLPSTASSSLDAFLVLHDAVIVD